MRGPLRAGTWRYCSGREIQAARGMRGRVNRAALGGPLEMLRWVREHDCPWDWMITACAAEAGNLEVLRWARMHHCPCNVHFLLLSATTMT